MNPEIKTGIDALGASLDAQANSYKSILTEPSSGILDGLRGTIGGMSESGAPGTQNLVEKIGAMLKSGGFSDAGSEIAGSILPEFVAGTADGFMGQWATMIAVLVILWIGRMVLLSLVGSINHRGAMAVGTMSFGNPASLTYILVALGSFGLAGYYGLSRETAEADHPKSFASDHRAHFRAVNPSRNYR